MVVAIERVLKAERASDASIQDCRHRADEMVAAARGSAARIAQRTDARISRLHAAYLQEIDRHIADLSERSKTQEAKADFAPSETHLARAAERLAARLASDT